jgi:hypothetical protein
MVCGLKMSFHMPEKYREAGKEGFNHGLFRIPNGSIRNTIIVTASDEFEWERVTVSKKYESPTWDEMCKIKDLFWDVNDYVLQYHPPRRICSNYTSYSLDLWRPIGGDIPLPPEFVG